MINQQHNGAPGSPTQDVAHNMAELAQDIVALFELQTELLKIELQQWLRSVVASLGLLLAAIVVGLAAVPVLLLSLAYFLSEVAGWSLGLSLLVVGLAGLTIAVAALSVGLRRLQNGANQLSRSREELARNVRWIKSMLANASRQTREGRPTHAVK